MDSYHLTAIFISTVVAATPLIYAALGELVVERSGVLNLGVEGMMLIGAVTAFAVGHASGSLLLGYAAGIVAATALSVVFAFLTLTMQANQVATGLAPHVVWNWPECVRGPRFRGPAHRWSGAALDSGVELVAGGRRAVPVRLARVRLDRTLFRHRLLPSSHAPWPSLARHR